MGKRHDWEPVKSEYIEGYTDSDGNHVWPTLQQLSERHGISESTMRKRASQEDWANERNIFRQRVEHKRQEKRAEHLAGKASEFDATIFRASETATKHIQAHLAQTSERFRQSGGRDPMPLAQLEQLAKSLERYQKIGRLALGEATDITEGDEDGTDQIIIKELVGDPDVAAKVKELFRSRTAERTR